MASHNSNTLTLPRPHGAKPTKLQETESGFKAPKRLRDNLQRALVDLISLQMQSKQVHWNIVGPNFRDLHENLDDVFDVARAGADQIAERMRALHATPDGRTVIIAAETTLADLPAGEIPSEDAVRTMVQAIEACVQTMRAIHDAVDEDDPASADLLHESMIALEQQAWFLGAEIRKP